MKSKTERILSVLRVIAWIAMVGYAFVFGSQLISFLVTLKYPAASKQFEGVAQNFSNLFQFSLPYYVIALIIIIISSGMLVYLWLMIVMLLTKLNIKSPFTIQVAGRMERIAYWLFVIWIFGFIGKDYAGWLTKTMGEQITITNLENAYLFSAGIVYIMSQIFKQGIEIQEENAKTI